MEEQPLWPSINETFVDEYSRIWGSTTQIIIFTLAGIMFALVICLYGCIRWFDASTKISAPTQYSIRFDPKGFSNNELRLYNVNSVNEGCKLKEFRAVEKGHVRVLTAEKLFDKPEPRLDPLLQPWNGGLPPTQTFHIIDWSDYIDDSQVRQDPGEASEVPGGGESAIPSNQQSSEEKGKSPSDKKPASSSDSPKPQQQPLSMVSKSLPGGSKELCEKNETSNVNQESRKGYSKETEMTTTQAGGGGTQPSQPSTADAKDIAKESRKDGSSFKSKSKE